jgi:hypothetical protein
MVDITDAISNPLIIAEASYVEYVDPKDAGYRILEARMPALPFPGQPDRIEKSGADAMRFVFQTSLVSVLFALTAYDQDMADDLLDVFREMGAVDEKFPRIVRIVSTRKEPPPS